jgi:hypothetical protein
VTYLGIETLAQEFLLLPHLVTAALWYAEATRLSLIFSHLTPSGHQARDTRSIQLHRSRGKPPSEPQRGMSQA